MPVKQTITKGNTPVKIWTDDIDPKAYAQLANIARLPFIHSHVAAMPDVHLGLGATVGSVIPTKGAIIPAAVGVDIGCGMNAVRLSLTANELPENLREIRSAIEAAIPVGFAQHRETPSFSRSTNARRSREHGNPVGQLRREVHLLDTHTTVNNLKSRLDQILTHHPDITKRMKNPGQTWLRQIGTLGGGNHFIELCLDEQDRVWIMLHSGSRGIGNIIGRYFIALAKKDMERLQTRLPDRDLAYFTEGTAFFDDYWQAVAWAQDYAMVNRREMMHLIVDALMTKLPAFKLEKEAVNCHHNYVTREEHYGAEVYLTRKGAIRAGAGEIGIIPGSMGARSYIVRGKGNAEAFDSCAHGAGRKMSRTEAKRRFNKRDMAAQTEGVECRKDKGVIDEIPGAYKDIDQVMANQEDLVEVVHILKQVICVKG